MITIVEAKLRGPDSLVWPVERGYAPTWMPNYGEFTGRLDTPEGVAVVRAYQEQTALPIGPPGWRVVEIAIRSKEE